MHLWNITDQRIMDSASVHEMVTAIAFAPRGERLVVGSMKGRCRFFACTPRTCKLEYEAQIGVAPVLVFKLQSLGCDAVWGP